MISQQDGAISHSRNCNGNWSGGGGSGDTDQGMRAPCAQEEWQLATHRFPHFNGTNERGTLVARKLSFP